MFGPGPAEILTKVREVIVTNCFSCAFAALRTAALLCVVIVTGMVIPAASAAEAQADPSGNAAQAGTGRSVDPAAATAGATANTTKEKTDAPAVVVRCVFVRDHELLHDWIARFGGKAPAAGRTLDAIPASAKKAEPTCPEKSDKVITEGTLRGAGDVELVVTTESYRKAAAHESERDSRRMLLYLNGVPMQQDAELVAVERQGTDTHLRYNIKPGKDSQPLWAMLYRAGGLTQEEPLRAALGWKGTASNSEPTNYDKAAKVAITYEERMWIAFAVLAALLVLTYLAVAKTDAVRDAPLPEWWARARSLRDKLRGESPENQETLLKGASADYDAAKRAHYLMVADKALRPRPLEISPDEQPDAIIGLALREKNWTPVRAAYSLSRVQLAMWFAFAVAAGVFLWIVYGQLPAIDGSLVALLGLSVATTAGSFVADRNAGGRPYSPSQGILIDLVTGFDEKHQVHRYQAVVVNLLLLFVGISHVLQQLTYPIFEPTWLALLGISGAAFGLGKKVAEKAGEKATEKAAGAGGAAAAATPVG